MRESLPLQARHVNYLGEIVQGIALALPATFLVAAEVGLDMGRWWQWRLLVPWLYPIYYVALFIPRAKDDDKICRQKYGAVWDVYTKQVPYTLIPGVW